MTIVVRGQSVCSYCSTDIGAAADKSGLNSLTVVNTAKTYDPKKGDAKPQSIHTWSRDSNGKITDKPSIRPITTNPLLPSSTLPTRNK